MSLDRMDTSMLRTPLHPGQKLEISPKPLHPGQKLVSTNPKKAHGALKAPMSSVPTTALVELYAVMGAGAHKYGAFNFRDSPIDAMTYIGAIRRHFLLWEDGEDVDDETKRSHLAHIMACCSLALDAMHTGQFVDNRSKTGLISQLLKDCAATHNTFTETWRSSV
jgi:hypothetical protein